MTLAKGDTFFVDNYNEEFSRDVMPMKGGYGDDYYMQLVDGIRRFKGVRPVPVAHGFQTIRLAGAFAAWAGRSARIPGRPRRHAAIATGPAGAACTTPTRTGPQRHRRRQSRLRRQEHLLLRPRPASRLTPYTDPNWMQLLIDADRNPKTGWNGYDFVVNSRVLERHHDHPQTPVRRQGLAGPVPRRQATR